MEKRYNSDNFYLLLKERSEELNLDPKIASKIYRHMFWHIRRKMKDYLVKYNFVDSILKITVGKLGSFRSLKKNNNSMKNIILANKNKK